MPGSGSLLLSASGTEFDVISSKATSAMLIYGLYWDWTGLGQGRKADDFIGGLDMISIATNGS